MTDTSAQAPPVQAPSAPEPPRPAGRSRAILINTLSSYGRDLTDALVLLVSTPFLLHALGKESFGLWSLIWSFLGLFELLDLGFGTSVVKYIASARGQGDETRMRRTVCTLFWVYAGLGTILLAGISASLLCFNRLFNIPPHQQRAAAAVLLLLGLRSALCMPLGLFRGVLVAMQRMSLVNFFKALASILYLAAILLVIGWRADLRLLAGLNMIAGVAPLLAMALTARRLLPGLTLAPAGFDRTILRSVTSFSIFFFLIQISRLIYTRVDAMVIQSVLSLEMVAAYSIAMRITERAGGVCHQLTHALTPVVAELQGSGELDHIRAVWLRGSKLSLAMAFPLLGGIIILADPLIHAWTGPAMSDAVPACRWLAAAALLGVLHGATANILSMTGFHRFLAVTMIVEQTLNLGLSLLLVRPLGIVGVAMATFLACFPLQVALAQPKVGRYLGLPQWRYYTGVIGPCLAPGTLMAGALWGLLRLWPPRSLVGVALLELAAIAIFSAAFWLLGFNRSERQYFSERVFGRILRRIRPCPGRSVNE